MNTRLLENQTAIVTGSSSGNGRAIALALSAAGATVVCADLHKNARKEGYEEDLEIDTDDVIQRRGGRAVYVQVDVRYPLQVKSLVTRAATEFGRLDIMINNAGVFTGLHTIIDESEDLYDSAMAVNAKGCLALLQVRDHANVNAGAARDRFPWKDCEHRLGHGSHRRRSPFRPQRLKRCGSQSNAPVSGHFWSPANQCERPLSGIHPNSDDSTDKRRNRITA